MNKENMTGKLVEKASRQGNFLRILMSQKSPEMTSTHAALFYALIKKTELFSLRSGWRHILFLMS